MLGFQNPLPKCCVEEQFRKLFPGSLFLGFPANVHMATAVLMSCVCIMKVGKTFAYGKRMVDDDKALAELGFQVLEIDIRV